MKNDINDEELLEVGLQALKNKFGVVNTLRFLEIVGDDGKGDYTKEKYLKNEQIPTDNDIRKMFGLKS